MFKGKEVQGKLRDRSYPHGLVTLHVWIAELESHELDHYMMVTNTKKDCRLLNLNLSHLNNALYMLRKAKRIQDEVKDRSQLQITVYST